jgi:hypothetical protein
MFAMNGMEVFTVLVEAIAVFVLVLIGVVLVKLLLQWRTNEAAPLLNVEAMVVSHRVRGRRNQPGMDRALYFVTFEEESGERLELQVGGQDFDQLAEGDRGHLIHQGTRFKGFSPQRAVDGPR